MSHVCISHLPCWYSGNVECIIRHSRDDLDILRYAIEIKKRDADPIDLFHAIKYKQWKITNYLMDFIDINSNYNTEFGLDAPLYAVILYAPLSKIREFERNGANYCLKNNQGVTFKELALMKSKFKRVRNYFRPVIEQFILGEKQECPICLEQCENFTKWKNCKHTVCSACYQQLRKWNCPLCRGL